MKLLCQCVNDCLSNGVIVSGRNIWFHCTTIKFKIRWQLLRADYETKIMTMMNGQNVAKLNYCKTFIKYGDKQERTDGSVIEAHFKVVRSS